MRDKSVAKSHRLRFSQDDRRPTTDNRQRTTNDARPTTDNRRRTANDGRPTTDDRQLTATDGRPTTDNRPVSTCSPRYPDLHVNSASSSPDSLDLHINFIFSLPILAEGSGFGPGENSEHRGPGENSEHRENNRFLPFQEFSAESSHLWYNVWRRHKRRVILEEIKVKASRKKRKRDNEKKRAGQQGKTSGATRQNERDGKEGVNLKTAVDGCLISHGDTEARRHGGTEKTQVTIVHSFHQIGEC